LRNLEDIHPVDRQPSRRQVVAEIVLIFAVFAIQGAWPVPDVNESHYLGKVIHYWNPGWLGGDFFMESPDTHKVFCLTFGWLSLWLSLTALAWTGRILAWALLAWAWRRLSSAVVPRAWWSVLTAALFTCLVERCNMAGEWVIGGLEAKPFAYVFVFLGVESLVRNRWNRALILFGAAAAFHVVVGGWAAVAAGVAWLFARFSLRQQEAACGLAGAGRWLTATNGRGFTEPPALLSLWPGIVVGLMLALPGLVASLALDWGTNRETVRAAHQIYVFERLPHHLTLTGMRPDFILRLALLWAFWLLLGRWSRRLPLSEDERQSVVSLRAFVSGAVAISLAGAVVNSLMLVDRALAADLLRYYWFRLSDVALPLGVALEGIALLLNSLSPHCQRNSNTDENSRGLTAPGDFAAGSRGPLAPGYCRVASPRSWLALAILVAVLHVSSYVPDRVVAAGPRSHKTASFADWRAACRWVADSGKIPPEARFLVPRLGQNFKWYAGRSDVVNWKDVPQNARSLIEWRDRIQTIYATGFPEGPRWYDPLALVGAERLRELGAKYGADFVISERTDPLVKLDVVYQNDTYVIYRLK
jgi:hypothetical protein